MAKEIRETAHFVGRNKKSTDVWCIFNEEERTYRFYVRRPIYGQMPFDKFVDQRFVHCTGYKFWTSMYGVHWQPEYEDSHEVKLIEEAYARMAASEQA